MRSLIHVRQIMRLDYVQRRRQWEAEQDREAPLLPSDPLEDEEDDDVYDLPTSSIAMQMSAPASQQPFPEEEVDEVLQREDEELQALLSLMPNSEDTNDQTSANHPWSDDDDYDTLFSEMMQSEAEGELQDKPPPPSQGEAMDLT